MAGSRNPTEDSSIAVREKPLALLADTSCAHHVAYGSRAEANYLREVERIALELGWSGRRVSRETASGIMIAALGALEMRFGIMGLRKPHFLIDKSGSI